MIGFECRVVKLYDCVYCKFAVVLYACQIISCISHSVALSDCDSMTVFII